MCLPYSENVFHKAHTNADRPLLLTIPSVSLSLVFELEFGFASRASPVTNTVGYTNEGFLSTVTKMIWELLPGKGLREMKK